MYYPESRLSTVFEQPFATTVDSTKERIRYAGSSKWCVHTMKPKHCSHYYYARFSNRIQGKDLLRYNVLMTAITPVIPNARMAPRRKPNSGTIQVP